VHGGFGLLLRRLHYLTSSPTIISPRIPPVLNRRGFLFFYLISGAVVDSYDCLRVLFVTQTSGVIVALILTPPALPGRVNLWQIDGSTAFHSRAH
jgi:hypothetical protein